MPTYIRDFAQTLSNCKDPSDYAYCTCAVYSCGYSQPNRKNLTISRLESGTAEADCSSAVNTWLYWGRYLNELVYFYTSIEREYLLEHGFRYLHDYESPKRNDVLWRQGHTGLYIGDSLQAELIRDENHDSGWEGSTPGDQDGGESVVRTFNMYEWDAILRKVDPPKYDKEEKDMTFIFRPNGDEKKVLTLYDGGTLHPLMSQAEVDAIKEAYRKSEGKEIPMFELGNRINMLGDAFIAAIKRTS